MRCSAYEFEFHMTKDALCGAQVAGRLDSAAQRGEFFLLRQRRDGNGNRHQLPVRSSRGHEAHFIFDSVLRVESEPPYVGCQTGTSSNRRTCSTSLLVSGSICDSRTVTTASVSPTALKTSSE